MKSIIALILFFLLTAVCTAQTLPTKWNIDLNNDSVKDQIKLEFKDSTYYLNINNIIINLNSSVIQSIVDENNRDNAIIIDDIDNDKEKEIIVNVEDPIFYNKSILKIFRLRNSKIIEQPFIVDDEEGSAIVSLGKIVVYDHKNKSIYVKIGNHKVNATNNETFFYSNIILLKWNKSAECMVKMGEKYFEEITHSSLNKIIWDRNN
jgi:hypothetical protein